MASLKLDYRGRDNPKKDMPSWITLRMPMTKQELVKFIGPKCATYEKGCPSCDNWELWRRTKEADVSVVRDVLVKAILNGDM